MALDEFSSEQRVKMPKHHHIDSGFINHRRIFTTFGPRFHSFFESKRKPGDDHFVRLWNDHMLVTFVLDACRNEQVKTLGEVLASPKVGDLFCSTEELMPCPDVYEKERVTSTLKLPYDSDWTVELNYSTQNIVASTGRMILAEGGYKETIIAGITQIDEKTITAHPLVIGAPSFDHPRNDELGLDLMFHGFDWYEIHPEDIDEFSKLTDVDIADADSWQQVMAGMSEDDVKTALCSLLHDIPGKDWGGEIHDHFASAVHLSGKRRTVAFALKGPARFEKMAPRHLGKNADQIYRLSTSPADVLVVQHCHEIGDAVRATLRAFAVNPSRPRQYCLIDGRDTYRILKAYGKLP